MRAVLLLSIATLAACSVPGGMHPGRDHASISGKIMYPSEVTPQMRICALPLSGPAVACVDSLAGSTQYHLQNLPAGEYRVVAALSEGEMRVGGHMHQVQCIRAPCPAQLQSVTVGAGAQLSGIDLDGFYAAREDFPPLR